MSQQGLWRPFECQRCGRCCREIGLPCDPGRVFEIAKHLDISVREVIIRYYGHACADGNTWESDNDKRTPCPFLRDDGHTTTCTVYPVRPDGCRAYPLETDFGRQGVDCPAATMVHKRAGRELNSGYPQVDGEAES